MKQLWFIPVLAITAIMLASCTSGAEPSTKDVMPDDAAMTLEMTEEPMDSTMAEDKDDMMSNETMEDMGEHDDTMMEDNSAGDMDTMEASDTMPDDNMADEANDMSKDAMMSEPLWFSVELTNVRTNEIFAINQYKGKVILVETLAMWCSNCLKQQEQVLALHQLLGEREDFISIGLDIDPNEKADALKSYIAKQGFTWTYAIAPAEVARDIAGLYGQQFLNPPSTPMLIIDRHGEAHPLPFGIKSADDLLNALQPFLDEEM